ncbi:hypothetical protein BSLG_007645 [Batrachochytrium salamandrivorans]|nr:hypothetical protein BSLG_007645 [Batrachochytrium salamandrivorans]
MQPTYEETFRSRPRVVNDLQGSSTALFPDGSGGNPTRTLFGGGHGGQLDTHSNLTAPSSNGSRHVEGTAGTTAGLIQPAGEHISRSTASRVGGSYLPEAAYVRAPASVFYDANSHGQPYLRQEQYDDRQSHGGAEIIHNDQYQIHNDQYQIHNDQYQIHYSQRTTNPALRSADYSSHWPSTHMTEQGLMNRLGPHHRSVESLDRRSPRIINQPQSTDTEGPKPTGRSMPSSRHFLSEQLPVHYRNTSHCSPPQHSIQEEQLLWSHPHPYHYDADPTIPMPTSNGQFDPSLSDMRRVAWKADSNGMSMIHQSIPNHGGSTYSPLTESHASLPPQQQSDSTYPLQQPHQYAVFRQPVETAYTEQPCVSKENTKLVHQSHTLQHHQNVLSLKPESTKTNVLISDQVLPEASSSPLNDHSGKTLKDVPNIDSGDLSEMLHSSSEMLDLKENETRLLEEYKLEVAGMADLSSKVTKLQRQLKEVRQCIRTIMQVEEERYLPQIILLQAWIRGWIVRHRLREQGIVFNCWFPSSEMKVSHLTPFVDPDMLLVASTAAVKIQSVWHTFHLRMLFHSRKVHRQELIALRREIHILREQESQRSLEFSQLKSMLDAVLSQVALLHVSAPSPMGPTLCSDVEQEDTTRLDRPVTTDLNEAAKEEPSE